MAHYARVVGESLGDLIGVACTVNEPNIVALMVISWVSSRRRRVTGHDSPRSTSPCAPVTSPCATPCALRRAIIRLACRFRCTSTRRCRRRGTGRFVSTRDGRRVPSLGRRRRFHRRAVLHEARVRSGWTHRPPGGRTHRDGYLFWPECVEYTIRRTASMVNIPIIMTENGIGTDDDEQRIRYLTGALAGLSNVLADGIDVRAISSGRCSTTSNGPSAIGPSSASSPSTARPSRGLPSHQRAGTPRRRESSPRPSSPSRIRHRPIERSR